jgi:hypothetical protein
MRIWSACLVAFACCTATPVFAACPPAGSSVGELQALRAAGFKLEDTAQREALALALVECLDAADPALRDGIAFEGLATWLRADALSQATRAALLARVQPLLAGPDDAAGFRRPFAALALSEIVRTDRIASWLTPAQRAALVTDAAAYLAGVRDYRGFVDGEGWRHGVAHGSDLALQLALDPAIAPDALDPLLAAARSQVVAADGHAYVHGEAGRLARAVYWIAARGGHDRAFWDGWLADVAKPAPLPAWDAAFASEAGLARLHDTRDFLQALYVLVERGEKGEMQARLGPGLDAALAALP